jgi:hypothetical protein
VAAGPLTPPRELAAIADCLDRGAADAALALCREALDAGAGHRPDLLNLLGYALAQLDRCDEAVAAFAEAASLSPGDPEAQTNLGVALLDADRLDEAAAPLQRALTLFPHHANALYNFGLVNQRAGRLNEAVSLYRRALAAGQRDPDCAVNLGIALKDTLTAAPDNAGARYNLALAQLLDGDFAEGWAGYEARWQTPHFRHARRDLDGPVWDGAPLPGKTLLLQGEQGLGDVLQFVRYAALAKRTRARVILRCRPRLAELLASVDGIDAIFSEQDDAPPHDAWAHLMSLPRILGTTVETVPARIPYVHPDPARIAAWRARLDGIGGLRVGIGWQGDPGYAGDARRSIPLPAMAPLGRVPHVTLVSLQKGPGRRQLLDMDADVSVLDLGPELDEGTGAFVDTAAVLQSLDLIVTSDTALAHVAGATGRPTWLALPQIPDWRWMRGRDDSPWYPTMRLFRQTAAGDWDGVFSAAAAALSETVTKELRP